MNRFTIRFKNYPKIFTKCVDISPQSNSAILLNFSPDRVLAQYSTHSSFR